MKSIMSWDKLSDEVRKRRDQWMATGHLENLVFAATGVTPGDLLEGVRFFGGGARTHSLVMAYQSKQVRFVDTVHMFDRDSPPRVRVVVTEGPAGDVLLHHGRTMVLRITRRGPEQGRNCRPSWRATRQRARKSIDFALVRASLEKKEAEAAAR